MDTTQISSKTPLVRLNHEEAECEISLLYLGTWKDSFSKPAGMECVWKTDNVAKAKQKVTREV
ncbi:unnamed protein product [Penicillium roqueforti FM164]|uniref:Genomic scaffold, ProqFM164S03 n=1 Tax=Penicillium roqueforti (strain FM164) TaxID=1365484 RepID=W6QWC0_PENRF|nr:unnamed protein product [Penicillium roqueforti FM164]